MSKLSILVVEDDPLARKTLEATLSDHHLDFAPDSPTARRLIAAGGHQICFIDLNLGEKDAASGLDLIPLAAKKGIYSVVMSGHDAEPIVDRAHILGCDDFYTKGNEHSNVKEVLSRYHSRRQQPEKGNVFTQRFITQDPATQSAVTDALKYATSQLPLLILGPSGTGKTSLAQIIHDHSGRQGQFIAINCSAYTESLLEAELFGFKKGAFTGANDNRKGKLLLADEGTLFLDEIGSMSLAMQTKLLKAIEERSFYPLGADKPETSHFRLISATLEDVHGLIKAGKLRWDFFQRIHGLTVALKPLVQRKEDLFPLIAYFTRGQRRLSFSAEAKAPILAHDWPGNVRELKKFVDLLLAGSEGRVQPETALKLIKTLSIEEGQGFVSEEQYRFALERGLDAATERFVDTIIARNLAQNEGKKTKVLTDLQIATRLLYTSLARKEKQ